MKWTVSTSLLLAIAALLATSCTATRTEVPPLKRDQDLTFPERLTKGILTSAEEFQRRR